MRVDFTVCPVNVGGAVKWEFIWWRADEEESEYRSGKIPVSMCATLFNVSEVGDWLIWLYDADGAYFAYPSGRLTAKDGGTYEFDCVTHKIRLVREPSVTITGMRYA